jgi:hypothetical protein
MMALCCLTVNTFKIDGSRRDSVVLPFLITFQKEMCAQLTLENSTHRWYWTCRIRFLVPPTFRTFE